MRLFQFLKNILTILFWLALLGFKFSTLGSAGSNNSFNQTGPETVTNAVCESVTEAITKAVTKVITKAVTEVVT